MTAPEYMSAERRARLLEIAETWLAMQKGQVTKFGLAVLLSSCEMDAFKAGQRDTANGPWEE